MLTFLSEKALSLHFSVKINLIVKQQTILITKLTIKKTIIFVKFYMRLSRYILLKHASKLIIIFFILKKILFILDI